MSKIKNTIEVTGRLQVILRGADGVVKDAREVDNLVVNAGLAFIASRLIGTSKAVMSHMALGGSTTLPAATQTNLISMLGSREAIDSAVIGGVDGNQVVYTAIFEPGDATGAITEAGVFNGATGGDMLCRTTFAVVNKGASDSISMSWTLTFSAV